MMRRRSRLGRLVDLAQRRAAAVLAPELEHEGAHLLGVVGELEGRDVLRHVAARLRRRCSCRRDYAESGADGKSSVEHDLVLVVGDPDPPGLRERDRGHEPELASGSPLPWNVPAAIRWPSSPVTQSQ